MSAELIKTNDGVTLRGARVSWTYADDYRDCDQIALLRLIVSYNERRSSFYVDITFNDNSVELNNLVCNSRHVFSILYNPRINYGGSLGMGTSLFYGGKL